MHSSLIHRASLLRDALVDQGHRIVFAESCTGGWLAASMATLPGISQCWCGSMVVYRSASKHEWLGIEARDLNDPLVGPVSELVTHQLAVLALQRTPEASIAVAVTGDIGPGVDAKNDGRVYFALAQRDSSVVSTNYLRLSRPAPVDAMDVNARVARLEEASLWIFAETLKCLRASSGVPT